MHAITFLLATFLVVQCAFARPMENGKKSDKPGVRMPDYSSKKSTWAQQAQDFSFDSSSKHANDADMQAKLDHARARLYGQSPSQSSSQSRSGKRYGS